MTSVNHRRKRLKVLPRKPVQSYVPDSATIDPPSSTYTVDLKSVSGNRRTRPLRKRRKPRGILMSLTLYLLRLSILAVGVSAIAGTALTFVKPGQFLGIAFGESTDKPSATALEQSNAVKAKTKNNYAVTTDVKPTRELLPLKQKLEKIAAEYPKLQPQAYFIDLDNGAYVDINAKQPIAAASTIKIPILVAFLQAVDAGSILLDEALIMSADVKASGSGNMQYLGDGKKYSALETASKMMVISDNSATNMLIKRLGGKAALNQQFQNWGMKETLVNNPLPDLAGTNQTSPQDLAFLLQKITQGDLLSMQSRDRLFHIMRQTKTRTLLPQGLEKEAVIAHKTGDIGTMLGDAGIIEIPTGKRYAGAILVKRPHNDPKGREMIQKMSRSTYQHFKWYLPRPKTLGQSSTTGN